ncbi:hypothetical protein AAG906_003686 [Vitis piasezkii]
MSMNQLLNGSSCIPPKSNSHTFAQRKDYKNEKKEESGFPLDQICEEGLSWLLEWVEDCCEGKFRSLSKSGGLSNLGFLKKSLDVMNFCAHQSWSLKEDLKLSLLGKKVCSLTGGSRRLDKGEVSPKWAKLLIKSSGRKVPTWLLVVEKMLSLSSAWEFRHIPNDKDNKKDARAQLREVPFIGDTSSSLELFNNFLLKAAEQGPLAKAIGFKVGPPFDSFFISVGSPLSLMDQVRQSDASLETLSSALGPWYLLVGRDEDLEVNKALEACWLSQGGFLGLRMVGFEKEINSLLRKMESRKGHEGEGWGAIGFEFFRYEVVVFTLNFYLSCSVYSCLQHVNLDSFVEYSSMENKEVVVIVTSTSHEKGESTKQLFLKSFLPILYLDLSMKKAIGGGRKANEVYHRIGPPIALHTSISSTQ